MNWKMALGILFSIVGVSMLPFGWWATRIFRYVGLLGAVGAALAFSANRGGKVTDEGSSLQDPEIPLTAEARGFKGREVFERDQTVNEGSDVDD